MSQILKHEVAIIGGGPAGSTAAALLAKKGIDVILIERQAEAHHKVCGEFISGEALHYIDYLGINLADLGAHTIDELILTIGKKTWHTPLSFGGMSLSRFCLDEALISRAEKNGAAVRRGFSAVNLNRSQNKWIIRTSDGKEIHSTAIFLATGKHDLRNWNRPRRHASGLIGMKMHFKPRELLQAKNQVGLFFFRGGYIGIEPIENGLLNLCLLTDKTYFTMAGNGWTGLLESLRRNLPLLDFHLCRTSALWEKPLTISGMPYGYIYRGKNNMPDFFRLGDQMAVIPSFAGDGLAMAFHSAHLAAFHYLKRNGAETYHEQARRDFLPSMRNAVLASKAISIPFIDRHIALACCICPDILSRISCKIRLGRGDDGKLI
jgi:flavin-dependent dehydrogenase